LIESFALLGVCIIGNGIARHNGCSSFILLIFPILKAPILGTLRQHTAGVPDAYLGCCIVCHSVGFLGRLLEVSNHIWSLHRNQLIVEIVDVITHSVIAIAAVLHKAQGAPLIGILDVTSAGTAVL
jgi:hypothetical protein